MTKPWETLARTTVLDRGKFLRVELHRIRLPDGRVIDDWPWVITPDFAIAIAVTDDDRYLCFRQTKYSVEGLSLAPVGGYVDPGEPALEAAQRELFEETGYEGGRWDHLGSYPVDGNRGAGVAHLYLARGVHLTGVPRSDDLESQELLHLTRSEMSQALDSGEFRVLPWAAAVALALRHTGDGPATNCQPGS